MALNCLLLTQDPRLLELVRAAFSSVNVELQMRTDVISALEFATRRHMDSLVIDCDDVPQATDLLSQIRNSRSNKLSIIFAVVNATTSVSMAVEAGANFVLGKPVQDRQLRSFLEMAIPRMEREHRKYFRHKVELPIELLYQTGETFFGKMMNVSEGGLALTRFGPASLEGVVTVRFALPSITPQIIQAKADVVWKDAFAMGLRFLQLDRGCRSLFDAWLNSLDAHTRFQESATSSHT
jgi:CheY-like chemotaxis protein